VLDRLGLLDEVIDAGCLPTKAAFWTEAGWIDPPQSYGGPLRERPSIALNAERSVLDPLLLLHLERAPGCTVMLGHKVGSATLAEDGLWRVRVQSETGRLADEPIEGRSLIVADGRRSDLAAMLGNAPTLQGDNHRACVFAYFDGVTAPAENRSLFYLAHRTMAFLYPLGGERALLAAYVPKPEAGEWDASQREARLMEVFAGLPSCPSLARARRTSPVLVRSPSWGGAAFVGDATLSLDPMSGVGCGFAMRSADMAVDALAPVLQAQLGPLDAQHRGAALAGYAAAFDAYFPAHAKGIMADSLIGRDPASTARVYARITVDPELARKFIDLTGRVIAPVDFQRAYMRSAARTRPAKQTQQASGQ